MFRTIPPTLTHSFAFKFERTTLTPIAWTRFKLSFSEGGNGLGDPLTISLAGFIALSISCFTTVKEIIYIPDLLISDTHPSSWIKDIWDSVAQFNNSIICDRLIISDLLLLAGPQLQKN